MTNRHARPDHFLRSSPFVAPSIVLVAALAGAGVARASDPLGLYVGAAYGQAHIRAQLDHLPPGGTYSLGGFDVTHSAYQAMLGIRPLSFLGAEISYVDFGRGSSGVPGGSSPTAARVSQKGEGAFALLYLPVPVVDAYVKAGLARITTDTSVSYTRPGVGTCAIGYPNCANVSAARSSTDTSFAYGVGLQWKLGDWAVRGEYQRFSAAGANPTLFSIGMTYCP